ncbi:MAG TPA: hypothetical protein VLN26_05375 [Gaiellaceae bacterium]|nr:hypothetical protein [Gaiellaceae bacterium]
MRGRRRPPGEFASKAVARLREAPESLCPHCGRVTRTTTDGICADCWGSKGGTMGRSPEPPGRFAALLLRLVSRSGRSR